MSRRPVLEHTQMRPNHTFRYVTWLPSTDKDEHKTAQPFTLNWVWNCDGLNHPGSVAMSGSFFHCLDCGNDGFDLVRLYWYANDYSYHLILSLMQCPLCADGGGIVRHRYHHRGHRIIFVRQVTPSIGGSAAGGHVDGPPPPYQPW
jgi:hypothetical protein